MWDQRYAEPEYAYGTEPNDFLVEKAGLIPPGPVLCLAEGQGRNAVYLASAGHEVVAVDASSVGLSRARDLAAARGVEIRTVVADLADFEMGVGRWAGIVSIFCHLPPPLRRRVLRTAVQGLRPGGVLVLEAYTPRQLEHGTGGPPVPELLYDLESLRDDLAGLDLVHAGEVEREIHEGRYHHGRSAVVQVVGIRPAAP
ncbi:class I SAM-dependent methyltransferase [Myxococcota bacterium]|nr:class I SAM-dependent methyltransferase [Myxococcota bacterium]